MKHTVVIMYEEEMFAVDCANLTRAHKVFNKIPQILDTKALYILDEFKVVVRNSADINTTMNLRPKHWRFPTLPSISEYHGLIVNDSDEMSKDEKLRREEREWNLSQAVIYLT